MKILAVNPPFLPRFSRESRSPAVAKSGTLYYPMWLAYAVANCERHGHEVRLIDAPASGVSRDVLIAEAKEFNPRMAIVDTSTPSIENDIVVAESLIEAVDHLFVVLVGVHVSALPVETLRKSATVQAVAFGEYDATVAQCADVLEKNFDPSALEKVPGLAFRKADGGIIHNSPRPYIDELDEIPFVSSVYKKHLKDIHPYFYGHSRHPLVVLVSGRGCPFHCTYCVVPQTMHGHRYRKRSVENVVEEFASIARSFPEAREIMIEDDTLTADPGRCREFCRALIQAKATTIPWSANARADVDRETLRIMKKAGCRLLCVGFESGDQRILDNIKKGTRIEKIKTFCRDAQRAGILIHGCFMVGNRGESRETLETTLQFAKELNPDTAQFYPIMVYPGTEDYTYFHDKGWFVTHNYRDWLTPEGLHSSVVSNPDLTYEELVHFCDRARREFYLRPGYIAQKCIQIIRHPGETKRVVRAGATLMKYLFSPSLKHSKTSS